MDILFLLIVLLLFAAGYGLVLVLTRLGETPRGERS